MYKITYDITDAKGVNYTGEFQTIHKKPKEITRKVLHRHPGISLPFTTNKAEIKKA